MTKNAQIKLGEFPEELKNTGTLAHLAKGIRSINVVGAIKDDLGIIAKSAAEIVSVSEGITLMARTKPGSATGFVGLAMMGSFWLGYQRAMEDLMKGHD